VVNENVSASGIDLSVAGFVDDLGNPQATDYTLMDAFSIDQQSPFLNSVNMVSNNANTSYAKAGDIVILTFTGSEPLSSVIVEIAGTSVAPTNTNDNRWEAEYTMANEDTEGAISYEITYTDMSNNSVTQTDFGNVTYDKTPPVISPTDSTIINVTENNSIAILLTVSAQDTSAVTFSGADGADQHYFNVSTAGEIRWDNFSPDYEHPQDVNIDNTYWACLNVADQAGNTTSHCYSFNIQDAEDPISFRIDTIADASITENEEYIGPTPSITGIPIGMATWSLGGPDQDLFSIISSTGVVKLLAQDYESPSDANSDNTYEVTITATDANGNYAHESWTVTVTDVSEPSSFSIDKIADVVVAENVGYTSVTPSLSGDAPIGSVTWSLGGTDQGLFSINSNTGVVTLAAQDYESPSDGNTDNTYEVTITETDSDGNYANESWTVTVTDVPEGDIFYPNPASTVLNIKDAPSYVKIAILDLKGKKVKHGQLSTDKYNISDLDTGIYVLELQTIYGFKRRFKLKIQKY
ncbi:MAG: T9SS type A sorting domain-containing protein, partial [Bacteroidota bacterium]